MIYASFKTCHNLNDNVDLIQRTSYITLPLLQRTPRRPLGYLARQTTTNTPEIKTVKVRQLKLVQCRGFETIRRNDQEINRSYCATKMLIG